MTSDSPELGRPHRFVKWLRALPRRFVKWFHDGFKPGDLVTVVSVLVAGAGVVFAFASFKDSLSQNSKADRATAHQNAQAVQQSEDNAPFLLPGTPPLERGVVQTDKLNFGSVTKRADRLYIAPKPSHPTSKAEQKIKKARLVIPLENGGSGIALLWGKPVLISSCNRAAELRKGLAGHPGTYIIRSGEADQFGFFARKSNAASRPIRGGGWYSFDYQRWGATRVIKHRRSGRSTNTYTPFKYEHKGIGVMIWYSDGARSKLRWLCASYTFASVGVRGLQYAVTGQTLGQSGSPPR